MAATKSDQMGEKRRRIAAALNEIETALATSERLFANAHEGDCRGMLSAMHYWEDARNIIKEIGVDALLRGAAGRFLAVRDLCEKYSEAKRKAMTGDDMVRELETAKADGYDLLLVDHGAIQMSHPLNKTCADWQETLSTARVQMVVGDTHDRAAAAEQAGFKVKLLYRPPQI
jgi:hypothetical protein